MMPVGDGDQLLLCTDGVSDPIRGEDGMSLGLTRQRTCSLPLEVTGFVGRQRELASWLRSVRP